MDRTFEYMYSDFGEAEARRIYWVDYFLYSRGFYFDRRQGYMIMWTRGGRVRTRFFRPNYLDMARRVYDKQLAVEGTEMGTFEDLLRRADKVKDKMSYIEIRNESRTKILYKGSDVPRYPRYKKPPVKPPYKPPIRPPVISPQKKRLQINIAIAKRSIHTFRQMISTWKKELAKL